MGGLAYIHPKLLDTLGDYFWPSTVTMSAPDTTATTAKQPYPHYEPVAALTSLKCRLGPMISERPTALEIRRGDFTVSRRRQHLLIKGYYPAITDVMKANVDGTEYNILGVEHGGDKKLTRLHLELVKP